MTSQDWDIGALKNSSKASGMGHRKTTDQGTQSNLERLAYDNVAFIIRLALHKSLELVQLSNWTFVGGESTCARFRKVDPVVQSVCKISLRLWRHLGHILRQLGKRRWPIVPSLSNRKNMHMSLLRSRASHWNTKPSLRKTKAKLDFTSSSQPEHIRPSATRTRRSNPKLTVG